MPDWRRRNRPCAARWRVAICRGDNHRFAGEARQRCNQPRWLQTPHQFRTQQQREPLAGFVYAISAYGLWGFFPLYLKAVDHIPAFEVVAHRILWSVPVAGLLIVLLRRHV